MEIITTFSYIAFLKFYGFTIHISDFTQHKTDVYVWSSSQAHDLFSITLD